MARGRVPSAQLGEAGQLGGLRVVLPGPKRGLRRLRTKRSPVLSSRFGGEGEGNGGSRATTGPRSRSSSGSRAPLRPLLSVVASHGAPPGGLGPGVVGGHSASGPPARTHELGGGGTVGRKVLGHADPGRVS